MNPTATPTGQEPQPPAPATDPATAARLLGEAIDGLLARRQNVSRAQYLQLGTLLYRLGRHAEAEQRARQGLAVYRKDFPLWNLLGVVLKNLGRNEEALDALARAEKVDPSKASPLVNRGNVLLQMGDGPRAVETYRELLRREPGNAEHLRLLGRAHRLCEQLPEALAAFEEAGRMDPRNKAAWLDAGRVLRQLGRGEDALACAERGLAALPGDSELTRLRVFSLQGLGRVDEARALLDTLLAEQPGAAWAHHLLGRLLAPFDRPAANMAFRQAVALAPGNLDFQVDLADSLDRTRGPEEARNIHEAYTIARHCTELGGDLLPHARVLCNLLERSADHAAAARLGDFEKLGRYWAATGQPSALHHHLARVESAQDRLRLVDYHRAWGRSVDAAAALTPLSPAPPAAPAAAAGAPAAAGPAAPGSAARGPGSRIRIGFMSSDLRHHPVSYFVLPLLEGYDRSRFEVFCYSWSTHKEDRVQQYIASKVDAFRWHPRIGSRDAAQLIRNDGLDMLFELGGTTDMNKLEVMAWRPAPLQASWLGYPHSAGPESIDLILVDPWLKPPDPALLVEKPFELAHSWVVLGRLGFHEQHAILPGTPQDRSGRITYGTMNNPYKYRPQTLSAWAEVVRRTEGSRFLFVRPEGGAPAFRENIWRAFEAEGVARGRVEFTAVRGTHMQHYNEIDISLDTFPQTGGTTTCESLWMGVPVVSLVGDAFFERLSHSNLHNAGLGELCAFDRAGYVQAALDLAADVEKRRHLRATLRQRIRSHPLGQPQVFVDDFQDAVLRALAEQRA